MLENSYFVFLLASLLLAISPGPDNLFVLTQSALYGKKAGLLITLGLCSGLIFHTSLVAFGLAVICQSSWSLVTLKIFGACYLLFLSFKSFTATPSLNSDSPQLSNSALYQRGIIMNSTNPKVSLFFLAFLPQFISEQTSSYVTQVFILGGLFAIAGFSVFSGIAYMGGQLKEKLEHSSTIQLTLNRITGIVLAFLAINLITY